MNNITIEKIEVPEDFGERSLTESMECALDQCRECVDQKCKCRCHKAEKEGPVACL